MTCELSEKEFKNTFGHKMVDISHLEITPIDIWTYVNELQNQNQFASKTIEEETVEYVYRNSQETYDHVLIPTKTKNKYVVIVVDIANRKVFGHYNLDLFKEY